MRGLLLIGMLIALAIAASLSMRGSREHLGPATSDVQIKTEEVRQEVERITEERMKQLKELDR